MTLEKEVFFLSFLSFSPMFFPFFLLLSITYIMAPPPTPAITAQAVSGITGSISIACWIIVFAPQIYQNFTRKSAEGLSFLFVVLWLLGDIFNVIGAIMQGVLPTMTVLAIYYTLADLVLLWQCLSYGHGIKNKNVDPIHLSPANPLNSELEPLLESVLSNDNPHHQHHHQVDHDSAMQVIVEANNESYTESHFNDINGSNPHNGSTQASNSSNLSSSSCSSISSITTNPKSELLYNLIMVLLVMIAGFGGWYFGDSGSNNDPTLPPPSDDDLIFNPLAQTFGWFCAFLYLGSRVPQILLNFERKSCDGIAFLFFLFACLGNITYVVSILAVCTGKKYLLVNSSWLVGSCGTLFEDFIIFCQFFLYNKAKSIDDNNNDTDEQSV